MDKPVEIRKRNLFLVLAQGMAITFLLFSTSYFSYDLFHSLLELSTIIIAFGIFIVAWNFQKFQGNNFILLLGVAYFFVAALDLIHTLSYTGIALFNNTSDLPTQLWIAARYLESLSFVIAFLFLDQKRKLRGDSVFLTYLTIFLLLILSIFDWKIFPAAFIEGAGLTHFKITSEYVIAFLFATALVLLYVNRRRFDRRFALFLMLSLAVKIGSEMLFTEYASVFDFANLVGHLLKFFSFFLLYKAVLEIGLTEPYNVLFRDLKQSEENYRNLVDNSLVGVYRADLNGNYLYANEAMAKMFEFDNPEKMIRERAQVRYENPADRENFLNALRRDGRIAHYELTGITRTGRKINVLSSAILSESEMSGMLLDISRRKRAEKKIKKAAEV